MIRRVVTALSAAAALLTGSVVAATPAQAATAACRPGAGSPRCQVWTGKVSWTPDGDTMMININGKEAVSVRLIGIQAMEQSVYSKNPAQRRGECHALATTKRIDDLVKRSGGVVRLTAQRASSHSDVRNRPLRSVAVKLNGAWYDLGRDLIRNGYVMWQPDATEYAWNPVYRAAAMQAAREGKNMYNTKACGFGPAQNTKLRVHVNYDADGNDAQNVNGEWIRIDNLSSTAIPLARWWVRDSGLRRYTFPAGTVVRGNSSLYVHVGRGAATATRKHWGLTAPVFSNPTTDGTAMGDGAYLFDPQGDLRGWDLY